MNEVRKQRLMREALVSQDGDIPTAGGILRFMGIAALALFVVVFSGAYPN